MSHRIASRVASERSMGSQHKRELKASLLHAQAGLCFYCERPVSAERATIDHFIPQTYGGAWVQENLIVACLCCNGRKANKLPSDGQLTRMAALKGIPRSKLWAIREQIIMGET